MKTTTRPKPGAIAVQGTDYVQYLMAGIFAQTVIFGAAFSGQAMAQDLKEGLIDRFRTLPMSPAAVLIGRTNADLALNTISIQNASFMILFPPTFVSNAFVPIETLLSVLRVIAEWNPVSALVQAVRQLSGNLGSAPFPDA